MKILAHLLPAAIVALSLNVDAKSNTASHVSDAVIAKQRLNLAENTKDKGFGPQSPRNIDAVAGNNKVVFSPAPMRSKMNLCNIHFHKGAEHVGGAIHKIRG